MIKFFRNIRQNLLSEGKTGKYLKYAFGEIALVIIGILMALSINNWNENRKLRTEEQSLLKDLQSEVVANIEGLKEIIVEHQKSYDAAVEMEKYIYSREALAAVPDSLFNAQRKTMFQAYTFEANLGILKSMKSSGKINYITNKELLYALSSIEDKIRDALEDQEKIIRLTEDVMDDYWSHRLKGPFSKEIAIQRRFDNITFRYMVSVIYKGYRPNGIIEESLLLENFNHILEIIDKEIEQ